MFHIVYRFFPNRSLKILEENINDIKRPFSNDPKIFKFLKEYDLWKKMYINKNRLYRRFMNLFIDKKECPCFNQMMRELQKILNIYHDEKLITLQENLNSIVNINRTKLLRENIVWPTFIYGMVTIPTNYSMGLINKLLYTDNILAIVRYSDNEIKNIYVRPYNLVFGDWSIVPIVGILSYLLFSDTYPNYFLKDTDEHIKVFENFIANDQIAKKISSFIRAYNIWKVTHVGRN